MVGAHAARRFGEERWWHVDPARSSGCAPVEQRCSVSMGSQGVVDGLSGTIDGLRSFFYLIIKAGIMSVSVNQDLLMRRGDGKPAWLRYCFLNASDMRDLESSLFFICHIWFVIQTGSGALSLPVYVMSWP
jgi:hypothetical protein